MLKYWNETLENISKDPRSDKFKIIVNKIFFDVPLSYALGISPLITQNYIKDPTFNQLSINIDQNKLFNQKELEEDISKFFKGEEISEELFYEIGNELKNIKMIEQWRTCQNITKEKIISCIRAKNTGHVQNQEDKEMKIDNMKEELEYIGEHIEDMKEEIKELSDEELLFILKNDKMRVDNEDSLWEIVKDRIESKYGNKNQDLSNNSDQDNNNYNKNIDVKRIKSILLGSINAKNLKKEYFREYIELIEEGDIEREKTILNAIKEIFIYNIDKITLPSHKTTNIQEEESSGIKVVLSHQEGENFKGIFYYLQQKFGKNLQEQGIIAISASTTFCNRPEQVIDYEWNDYWASMNSPGNWLQFDFKKCKVKLDGYSLKTYKYGPDYAHLKNWIIEGSNDTSNWKVIDQQQNKYELNMNNSQHYYQISKATDEFQYIRIRNIGKNHRENKFFVLTNIEFYGEIINIK